MANFMSVAYVHNGCWYNYSQMGCLHPEEVFSKKLVTA